MLLFIPFTHRFTLYTSRTLGWKTRNAKVSKSYPVPMNERPHQAEVGISDRDSSSSKGAKRKEDGPTKRVKIASPSSSPTSASSSLPGARSIVIGAVSIVKTAKQARDDPLGDDFAQNSSGYASYTADEWVMRAFVDKNGSVPSSSSSSSSRL